jgi:hypothetical protein
MAEASSSKKKMKPHILSLVFMTQIDNTAYRLQILECPLMVSLGSIHVNEDIVL